MEQTNGEQSRGFQGMSESVLKINWSSTLGYQQMLHRA
jgi:hypothetical protein